MTVTLDHLLPLPVTLVTRSSDGSVDDNGEQVWTESELETRCLLQQEGGREEHEGNVEVVSWRVWLPADVLVVGWDAIRLADGTLLELEGDADAVVNPRTGLVHHVEARVRRAH